MKTKWQPITTELKRLAGWHMLVAAQLTIMFLGLVFIYGEIHTVNKKIDDLSSKIENTTHE